ncbi:MAG: PEP-CTERM sorting domain-containing protein [Verrucomicrobiaceae bacterium]|nr:MAG: PEP-CTERM sorting domain-containing protein [Verrucomicrobiaceae bacterium]
MVLRADPVDHESGCKELNRGCGITVGRASFAGLDSGRRTSCMNLLDRVVKLRFRVSDRSSNIGNDRGAMRPLLALAALAGFVFASHDAGAAVMTYHGTFTVSSPMNVNSSQIAAGDKFYYEFTLDSSVIDTNPSTSYAQFNGLFTNYRFDKAPTNTGTWDPGASGTWSQSANGFADNFTSGQLRVIFSGSGFQPIQYTSMMPGPFPGGGTQTTTSPSTNPHFNQNYTDTGSGQTFEQMFGTLNPSSVLPYFNPGAQTSVTSDVFGTGAHPLMVPEPSAVMLLGCGALGLALSRRKAK